MRKLLREPLLQFLLLGLGLFLLYGWIGPGRGVGERIVITEGRVAQLAASFALMHQRPPASDELDGLIDDAIQEEIYYREAKALGLDQDDTIVRRRLRQKMEFVSEDVTPLPMPTDLQLRRYLQEHPERFPAETRYSLAQVYLNPERRGNRLAGDVQGLLTQLQRADASTDASKLGDALLLEHRFRDITANELVRLFGARFETTLRSLPTNEWRGPVPSGFGVHLVRVDKREVDRSPALEQVHEQVRREWLHDQRLQANSRFYADLRKRFHVTVERPTQRGGPSGLVPQ